MINYPEIANMIVKCWTYFGVGKHKITYILKTTDRMAVNPIILH